MYFLCITNLYPFIMVNKRRDPPPMSSVSYRKGNRKQDLYIFIADDGRV